MILTARRLSTGSTLLLYEPRGDVDPLPPHHPRSTRMRHQRLRARRDYFASTTCDRFRVLGLLPHPLDNPLIVADVRELEHMESATELVHSHRIHSFRQRRCTYFAKTPEKG